MMLVGWFRSEQQRIHAAERDAVHLRMQYGVQAELWCQTALQAEPDYNRRIALKLIRRALQFLPQSAPSPE